MLAFIIEAVVICLILTLCCFALVKNIMKHLELAKLNYPPKIVQRLIDLGMVLDDKTLPRIQKINPKGVRHFYTVTWDGFPALKSGASTIACVGDVTSIEVIPRWRCL